ncbi:MAG: phosphatase PAP2 family protein [Terriglobia bacterium]
MSLRLLRLLLFCAAALLLALACPTRVRGNQVQPADEQASVPSKSEGHTPSRPVETATQPQPTLKEVPSRIIRDQEFLWLRPFRMKRSDLPWLGFMVGTTAGLMAVDRRVGQGLSDSPPGHGYTFSRYVSRLGGPWTDLGIAGAVYLAGRGWGEQHTETTGLLGLEAVGDSLVVVELTKIATQRARPTFAGGYVRDHNADGTFFAGGTSFPSGHAAAAFALATVVSQRNGGKRWVAPVAYGLASLVATSRITVRTHFPSDVFVGAALGLMIGRHVAHGAERSRQEKPLQAAADRFYRRRDHVHTRLGILSLHAQVRGQP